MHNFRKSKRMRDFDVILRKTDIHRQGAFERKYSYLLSWEDAEKKVGRRLDWNNNFDCCLYHDLLVEAVNAK